MNLNARVKEFVQIRHHYYLREFSKIQKAKTLPLSWNTAAFIIGPLWGAWRGVLNFFWIFLVSELFALILIARGLWMKADSTQLLRYEKLLSNIAKRQEQLQEMLAKGDQAGANTSSQIISNLQQVADQLAVRLEGDSFTLSLLGGVVLLLILRLGAGFYANFAYEQKYSLWCIRPLQSEVGVSRKGLAWGSFLLLFIWPITIFRFSITKSEELLGGALIKFPQGKEIFSYLAVLGDRGFDWLAVHFGGLFGGITKAIALLVSILEVTLTETPWPVVMLVLVIMAFRLAGPRVAIFTTASMAYLALMGLWQISMITVALIGAGTILCLAFGIPLGVWLGRNDRAHTITLPILDFMQTMPAFVYLIPIIAFFGTGKPPGVLATLVFAMPPVVRLTALGIRSVPETTREAAVAFGSSSWQLLRYVELPLAMPSIMTGINQTIMMSLSMVVISSLIGAEGLGILILESLQYAAKGQGLLGGIAILLCAMVIDRIIQGAYLKNKALAK